VTDADDWAPSDEGISNGAGNMLNGWASKGKFGVETAIGHPILVLKGNIAVIDHALFHLQ
jgi:hypothetical protein